MKLNKFTRKSITSMLLSLSLVVSQAASSINSECIAYADEASEQVIASILQDDGFGSCVNALLNTSADMSITGNLFEAYIGSPFNIYRIDSDMNISYDADTYYFPVIYNNDVCAFISASALENDFAISCGLYFADGLDTSDGSTDYSLIADENGNMYSADSSNNIFAIRTTYDTIDFAVTPVTTSNLSFELSDTYINTQTHMMTEWYSGARATTSKLLSNYPLRDQGDANNCWAHVIYSMASYKGKASVFEQVYGAFVIANGFNIDSSYAATPDECYNTIVYLFNTYNPVHKERQLTSGEIMYQISMNNPVFVAGVRDRGFGGITVGHAVALVGYTCTDGVVTSFSYMNPLDGTIRSVAYSADNCTFESAYYDYEWFDSITLS